MNSIYIDNFFVKCRTLLRIKRSDLYQAEPAAAKMSKILAAAEFGLDLQTVHSIASLFFPSFKACSTFTYKYIICTLNLKFMFTVVTVVITEPHLFFSHSYLYIRHRQKNIIHTNQDRGVSELKDSRNSVRFPKMMMKTGMYK